MIRSTLLSLFLAMPVLAAPPTDPPCREPSLPNQSSFVVACIGDSNTQPDWQGFTSWCERLEVSTINCGWGAATATSNPDWYPYDGVGQLEAALEMDPDLIIIALGTNDLGLLGKTPAETAAAIHFLNETAEFYGVPTLVASVPPSTLIAGAEDTNLLLNYDIDFYLGFQPLLDPDGVHFLEEGHVLRAERVTVPEPPYFVHYIIVVCTIIIMYWISEWKSTRG